MVISDQRCASFETRSTSAPQDEGNLPVPSKMTLILRRPPCETPPRRLLRVNQGGRLEGRAIVVQGGR